MSGIDIVDTADVVRVATADAEPASFVVPRRRVIFGALQPSEPAPAPKGRSEPVAWLDAMPDDVNEAMALWQR